MAKNKRVEQVAEEIKTILSNAIQFEIQDPRLGFVTLTSVNVSPDLYHANINVSVMGDDTARKDSLATLDRAKGFLRRELGQQMKLRAVPELHFHLDVTIDTRQYMDTLFNQVDEERRVNPPKLDDE
ncbi:MAG TPA: 30S ribosome-binding factor RbfA [Herpetosiphon sp.]|uniref:Ribosome-binding factor A n=2 Tax=Herpetosiphon TaxID=64 RepID=A9AV50_HERA2|nr:30S ribosome-binding factor RbfA [Herpetosiphon sp.]ABX03128.1 ribosome-binding factor A [Herpetosiphon aurantiacus DSM 785]MCA0354675.1 30S ribosome-binding factor RbfA [Chloroflexota bacterium]HBW50771.1 30S ribosome-binding factor RbfA [Herpetosiphon sp.]